MADEAQSEAASRTVEASKAKLKNAVAAAPMPVAASSSIFPASCAARNFTRTSASRRREESSA